MRKMLIRMPFLRFRARDKSGGPRSYGKALAVYLGLLSPRVEFLWKSSAGPGRHLSHDPGSMWKVMAG